MTYKTNISDLSVVLIKDKKVYHVCLKDAQIGDVEATEDQEELRWQLNATLAEYLYDEGITEDIHIIYD